MQYDEFVEKVAGRAGHRGRPRQISAEEAKQRTLGEFRDVLEQLDPE